MFVLGTLQLIIYNLNIISIPILIFKLFKPPKGNDCCLLLFVGTPLSLFLGVQMRNSLENLHFQRFLPGRERDFHFFGYYLFHNISIIKEGFCWLHCLEYLQISIKRDDCVEYAWHAPRKYCVFGKNGGQTVFFAIILAPVSAEISIKV